MRNEHQNILSGKQPNDSRLMGDHTNNFHVSLNTSWQLRATTQNNYVHLSCQKNMIVFSDSMTTDWTANNTVTTAVTVTTTRAPTTVTTPPNAEPPNYSAS
jgi:hypothetical protein